MILDRVSPLGIVILGSVLRESMDVLALRLFPGSKHASGVGETVSAPWCSVRLAQRASRR